MVQKLVAGAEFVPSWTTLVGAIVGVLAALRVSKAPTELMGITGHAFRLTLTERDGVLAAAPIATAGDHARLLPLYANGGWSFELLDWMPNDRELVSRRTDALKRIRTSIGRGRPVIASGLHTAEFGIIVGYDDRAHTLAVASMMSRQYGTTLPESRWPIPERPERLTVLIPRRAMRVNPQVALREAVRFALAYAHHGDPRDPTRASHGLAALGRWQDALQSGAPLHPAGHAQLIQITQSARRDAAAYLRAASAIAPAATGPLREAAQAYADVALDLSRIATLFPYPGGGSLESVGARLVGVSALRAAEAHERTALGALARAFPQLDA